MIIPSLRQWTVGLVSLFVAISLPAPYPEPPPPDDEPPDRGFALLLPESMVVPSCDGAPVVVDYPAPTASSECETETAVFSDPPPGSLFPLDNTTVTCWATNACGEAATNTFTVTVARDTAPPALTCPTNLVVYATSAAGAVVHYPLPEVTDDVAAGVTLECDPPPGSTFAPGTNTVNCVVTDLCGRSNSCSFTIKVRLPRMIVATAPDPASGATQVSVSAEGFEGMDETDDLGGEWRPLAVSGITEIPPPGKSKFFGPPGMGGVLRAPDMEIAYAAVGPHSAGSQPHPLLRLPVLSSNDLFVTNGVKVLSGDTGGTENQWSGPLTLPFTFYFYGRPYKEFRVSKNGLLTFSTNLTSNTQGLNYFNFPPANTTNALIHQLPLWLNGFAVDNTIFALAGRYQTQSAADGVYAQVQGSAPHRKVWIGFDHPKDIFGRTLTAIVLHEGANWIHIVDMFAATNNATANNPNSRLLCGLQGSLNSTREVRQISASPYMTLVTSSLQQPDNAAYLFRPYPLGNQISGQAAPQLMTATNLDLFITEQVRQLGIPGLTVAISRSGRLIFNKGYGYANVEFGEVMQPYHRACIGSVSKVLAGYGVAALIADGLITNFNERVFAPDRLGQPWFWNAVNEGVANNIFTNFFATADAYRTVISNMTVRQLLSHSAALDAVNNDVAVANLYAGGNYLAVTPRHHVQWHIRSQPLITNNVGVVSRYSNPGFKYLGVFIEEVAGQPYANWMATRLWQPAGVPHARLMTIYEADQTWRDARRYFSYQRGATANANIFTTVSPWRTSRISGEFGPTEYGNAAFANAADGAAGSYTATAADLVRFMAAVDGLPGILDILPASLVLNMEIAVINQQGLSWDNVTSQRMSKNGNIGYGGAQLVRRRGGDRLTVAVVANSGVSVTPLGNTIWNIMTNVPPVSPQYDLFGLQVVQP